MTGSNQNTTTEAVVRACPHFPKGGSAVKDELDRVCPIIVEANGEEKSTCPAIDNWTARLWVLDQQLEIAR